MLLGARLSRQLFLLLDLFGVVLGFSGLCSGDGHPMLRSDHSNDDRCPMTYWLSHGRLRVVLVFTQRYVVSLSIGSSGMNTLTTVLGTGNGHGLVVFKGVPNVCVRHLGLLGHSKSSRSHLSLAQV